MIYSSKEPLVYKLHEYHKNPDILQELSKRKELPSPPIPRPIYAGDDSQALQAWGIPYDYPGIRYVRYADD
jgi:hypothetical protein